jgi:Rieske Fe-S protein
MQRLQASRLLLAPHLLRVHSLVVRAVHHLEVNQGTQPFHRSIIAMCTKCTHQGTPLAVGMMLIIAGEPFATASSALCPCPGRRGCT